MNNSHPIFSTKGTLLSNEGLMVASYDLENQPEITNDYSLLSDKHQVFSATKMPFSLEQMTSTNIHIINGMGVSLGDVVVGLTAIKAIQCKYPNLQFTIYRPSNVPTYVKEFYDLVAASNMVKIINLPFYFNMMPLKAQYIDVGNHFYWPEFRTMSMIDFFLWALGVNHKEIDSKLKENLWLKELILPKIQSAWQDKPYILFCPTASTPIRSIPIDTQDKFIEALWEKYNLPILGFCNNYKYPYYHNISAYATSTPLFMSWIKHASHILTIDSSAVHLAAGFGVSCTAIFNTIHHKFRAFDYSKCKKFMLDIPNFENIYYSDDKVLLKNISDAFQTFNYTRV